MEMKNNAHCSYVADIILHICFSFRGYISLFGKTFSDFIRIFAIFLFKGPRDLFEVVTCFVIKTVVPM